MNVSNFNTPFLDREALSEQEELVKESQEWFNEFISRFLTLKIGKTPIIIHRAIFTAILNHEATRSIKPTLSQWNIYFEWKEVPREKYAILLLHGSAKMMQIHDTDYFTGWYIWVWGVNLVGNEAFQKRGRDIINRIQRTWLLELLQREEIEKTHETIKRRKDDLTRILNRLWEWDISEIENALRGKTPTEVKATPQT